MSVASLALQEVLHLLNCQHQPLLMSEFVEADVLQILDGDGEDVLDLRVPLGEQRGGVLGQVQ